MPPGETGGGAPNGHTTPPAARWGDLGTRVASGIAMAAVGAAVAVAGGTILAALAVLVTGLMIWELSVMTSPMPPVATPSAMASPTIEPRPATFARPTQPAATVPASRAAGAGATRHASLFLGVLGAVLLTLILWRHSPFLLPLVVVPGLVGVMLPRRFRAGFFLYALAIMLTGYGLVGIRAAMGLPFLMWLLLVVIASDVLGYFAGRALGGPKFWPAISPKKTWSGTIAGWIGAAVVGAGFVLAGAAGWGLVLLSPFVALAGQMGDIAESWLKRRTGVKDSSRLIPGHGGVLDRFDALIGAVVLLQAVALFHPLPIIGG